MDRAFFFAYAVQELDGFREEAWKIFRQPLNRLLSISYKTKTCSDERLLAQKFFCHPETTFSVNPKPFSATLSLFYCHPEPFLLSPHVFLCHPERSEGAPPQCSSKRSPLLLPGKRCLMLLSL